MARPDFDDDGDDFDLDDADDGPPPADDFAASALMAMRSPLSPAVGGRDANSNIKSSALSKVMGAHGIQSRRPDPKSGEGSGGGAGSASGGGGSVNFASHGDLQRGGAGGGSSGAGGNAARGPLPQVKAETVQVTRESYQLEQALRYHSVMKPRADAASPPEQAHILSHILSYFVHNGFSRSAEALFRSGAISQPIAASVRDGPYRDLPRMLGGAVSATSELFDDDTPWESELLFRFAQNGPASSSNTQGGHHPVANNNNNNNSNSSTAHPTHDFVILDERSRAQLGTVEFLMTKLVLEQNDVPFAARHRFDVNFTNVFLTSSFCFLTPDAFVARALKLFKAMQLHVSLLGENCVVQGCRRLLMLLAAYASANRIDIGRTTLERLLSLSVSILSHAQTAPSSGSAEVAQAAQQLLAVLEDLERAAASCGVFGELSGAAQLRKSVAHAMTSFGVTSASAIFTGTSSVPTFSATGSTTGISNSNNNSGAASFASGGAAAVGDPSTRWRSAPYLPFGVPPADIPRSAFRGDGPLLRLADVPEVEVARQLTLMHFALFCKIAPREFVSGAWISSTLQPIAQNLLRFVRQEDMVTQWVSSSVIMPTDAAERRAIYARFVRIMRLLFDMQNYSLASCFFQGLEDSNVRRMARTVSGSLSDNEQASYDVVKAAMNPFSGQLRSIPQDLRTACIPLLAPFVAEACRLHEAQASVVMTTLDLPLRGADTAAAHASAAAASAASDAGSDDGSRKSAAAAGGRTIATRVQLVNWSKMIAMAKILLKLCAFQSRPYAFDPDSVVCRLLHRLPLLRKDADRLRQISLEREPAASSASSPLTSQ